MNKKWFYNFVALTLAISLSSFGVNANANTSNVPYMLEVDDEDTEISDEDIVNYCNGFKYAYSQLSLASGCYSAMIQQSFLVSLNDEEAKNVDDVLLRTFNLLGEYEIALNQNNFDDCKVIINDLSLLVPEIKSSLAPILIPEKLIGSSLVFDDGGLVPAKDGFLMENGEVVTIIDNGFFTKKPSGIEELDSWFWSLGDGFFVPYYALATDCNAVWQLPVICSEAGFLYNYMVSTVITDFSVDPYTVSIVGDNYMCGSRELRELTEKEKAVNQSNAMVFDAERGVKVNSEKFKDNVCAIYYEYLNTQIEMINNLENLPYDENYYPDESENFSYNKII